MKCLLKRFMVGMLLLIVASPATADEGEQTQHGIEIRRYDAPDATQAVAVDAQHFYAIANQVIAKYSKDNGRLVKRWTASPEIQLAHLNSGVVLQDKLYCAHSNFPGYPEASSIEIWDTATLEHVGTHSLGICEGSLTWIDWHDNTWWALFAHYTEKVNDDPHSKDSRWTSFVRFDHQWRRTGGWVFPPEVIERFEPHSCSGGSWGDSGLLYCTGHDRKELYELALPTSGAMLRLRRTIPVPLTGQGFAWDRRQPGVLYGIDRALRQVIAVQVASSVTQSTLRTPEH